MEGSVDSQSPAERLDAGTLYRAHARFVASFLARLGIPRADVPDLVQDVFLIAHRKGGFEPGPAKARTWLASITYRVAAGFRRKKRPAVAAEVDSQVTADPELELQARRAAERIDACLEALDMNHRAVFVLFEIEGVKGAEIAEALDIPAGTVYRRLKVARERFAAAHAKLVRP